MASTPWVVDAVLATPGQGSAVQEGVVFVVNFAEYLRKIAPGTQ